MSLTTQNIEQFGSYQLELVRRTCSYLALGFFSSPPRGVRGEGGFFFVSMTIGVVRKSADLLFECVFNVLFGLSSIK